MRTEVLGVGIGDILKFEATTLTRVKVKEKCRMVRVPVIGSISLCVTIN